MLTNPTKAKVSNYILTGSLGPQRCDSVHPREGLGLHCQFPCADQGWLGTCLARARNGLGIGLEQAWNRPGGALEHAWNSLWTGWNMLEHVWNRLGTCLWALEQAWNKPGGMKVFLQQAWNGLGQAWNRLGAGLERAWNKLGTGSNTSCTSFQFLLDSHNTQAQAKQKRIHIYIYIYVYRYIPWGSLAARSYASIVMATVDTVTSLVTLGLVRLDGPSSSHITPLLCTSLGPTSPPHLWTPWGSHDVSSSQNLFL